MQVFEKRLYILFSFSYTSSNLTIHFLELWLCPHMEMVCTGCNGVDGAHVCSSVRFEDQASKQGASSSSASIAVASRHTWRNFVEITSLKMRTYG